MRDIRTPSTYFHHCQQAEANFERSFKEVKDLLEEMLSVHQSDHLTEVQQSLLMLEAKRCNRTQEKKRRMNKVKIIVNALLQGDDAAALSLMGDELVRRTHQRLHPYLVKHGREMQQKMFR